MFFFSSRRRHTRWPRDWSSDVCSSDLRRERGHGNKIIFESKNLSFASMETKLRLVDYVDRAIMTPNEIRQILGRAPYDGGDEFVRRLDTATIDERGE